MPRSARAERPPDQPAPARKPRAQRAAASFAQEGWTRRDLLSLQDLEACEIRALLREALRLELALADKTQAGSLCLSLAGRIVANLFLEDSTRTRVSFTVAAHRLGASVVDLTRAGSSASKGETLEDAARYVAASGVDALIVRCGAAGGPEAIARAIDIPVINAGDGAHEHPTQGLLDALTIAEAHNRLDGFDLSGLRVVYVGDMLHSRVARSGCAAMTALGASVALVGPPALAPIRLESLGCTISHNLEEALTGAHVAIALRLQRERHGESPAAAAIDLDAYARDFQLTPARAGLLHESAVVMHPGPMNRSVEIDSALADGPRSRIFRQPFHGVAVRMAALRLCLSADQ